VPVEADVVVVQLQQQLLPVLLQHGKCFFRGNQDSTAMVGAYRVVRAWWVGSLIPADLLSLSERGSTVILCQVQGAIIGSAQLSCTYFAFIVLLLHNALPFKQASM
jgi:hypothetical protein